MGVTAATREISTIRLSARTIERVFVVLAGWLMTGVFLDAGAHIRRLPDSFWTPWHGILYSGLLACGAFLVALRLTEARTGTALLERGYELSVLGVVIGGLAGIGDAIWHTLFGIEFDLDAAVSPSHLLVAAGILLVVSGPARAGWNARRFGAPQTLSLLSALSILTVIADYAVPFATALGTGAAKPVGDLARLQQTEALFAFVGYAALVAGVLLLPLRRVRLAPAAVAAIIGVNAIAISLVNAPRLGDAEAPVLAAGIAGALLAAGAAAWLRPGPGRPSQARAFAFAAPALVYAAYAVAIVATHPTWWTVTFWCGMVAVGGLAGLLVSSLVSIER